MNDYSMICQFALSAREDLTKELINVSKNFFAKRECCFKKIYAGSDDKVRSYGRHEFGRFVNYDYFNAIHLHSDFNSADFEPQTRLYADIDNSLVRGTPYTKPKPLVKYTLVVREELLKSTDEVFDEIVSLLSELPSVSISGHAFLVPNSYGAVTFSHGIATRINMPNALQNLLSWRWEFDLDNGFVGLFNCFSGLTKKQIAFLKDLFGKGNVNTTGRLTWLKNEDMNTPDIGDYFTSERYLKLCGELEKELSFRQLEFIAYGKQLNKPGVG